MAYYYTDTTDLSFLIKSEVVGVQPTSLLDKS